MRKIILILLAVVFVFSGFCLAIDNPQKALKEVIENYVRQRFPEWKNDRIEITFNLPGNVTRRLKGFPDQADLSVLDLYSKLKPVGNMIIPIQVKMGDEYLQRVFVRAKIEVFKKVIVAKERIQKGTAISRKQIGLKERNVALFPQKYFTVIDEVLDKEAKINISKRSTIFEWMIKVAPTISQFDNVKIIVRGNSLVVEAQGKAMEDGYVGRKIKVRKKGTQEMVEGVVLNANEVEVILK